jgi:hypothetical protein
MAKGGRKGAKEVALPPEVQREREIRSAERWLTVIKFGGWAVIVAASVLPMRWVYYCVKELAGKDTKASFGFTLTVSIAGAVAIIKVLLDVAKMKKQTQELVRLRERCANLEKQLSDRKSTKRLSE